MQRFITKDLIKWKNAKDRKPLLLQGIRQCGKTWLLKEFGKNEYDDVAYFNFEGNSSLPQRFQVDLDIKRILNELGILHGKPILPEKTLLIFDEIQFCSQALTSLKYFYENMPGYHIACASSLLGVALARPLSFPVGKVDLLTMRPLNYSEFLVVQGESDLYNHLQNLSRDDTVSELFTSKMEEYLRYFYIVGGMPEVVQNWIENKDVLQVEKIQQTILNEFVLDFAKHAPNKDFPRLTAIWNSIPTQLARE